MGLIRPLSVLDLRDSLQGIGQLNVPQCECPGVGHGELVTDIISRVPGPSLDEQTVLLDRDARTLLVDLTDEGVAQSCEVNFKVVVAKLRSTDVGHVLVKQAVLGLRQVVDDSDAYDASPGLLDLIGAGHGSIDRGLISGVSQTPWRQSPLGRVSVCHEEHSIIALTSAAQRLKRAIPVRATLHGSWPLDAIHVLADGLQSCARSIGETQGLIRRLRSSRRIRRPVVERQPNRILLQGLREVHEARTQHVELLVVDGVRHIDADRHVQLTLVRQGRVRSGRHRGLDSGSRRRHSQCRADCQAQSPSERDGSAYGSGGSSSGAVPLRRCGR